MPLVDIEEAQESEWNTRESLERAIHAAGLFAMIFCGTLFLAKLVSNLKPIVYCWCATVLLNLLREGWFDHKDAPEIPLRAFLPAFLSYYRTVFLLLTGILCALNWSGYSILIFVTATILTLCIPSQPLPPAVVTTSPSLN